VAVVVTDRFSATPLFVRLTFGEQEIAAATAFFYVHDGRLYLVSNWHNFAGRNPTTHQALSPTGGVPDGVSCYAILSGEFINRQWLRLPLRDANGPLWYEHPDFKSNIDIGVLPVTLPEGYQAKPINTLPMTEMRLSVSDDVFIIGYPFGLVQRGGMPIWKRASVASEPGMSEPTFLVDTATRAGMSGSPVLHKYRGFYKTDPTEQGVSGNDWFGEGTQFVGVYSGRIGESELEAQLGRVWKKYLIDEVIDGQKVCDEP
jgi:hypothetical protein